MAYYNIITTFLVLINISTFWLFGSDKKRAERGDWRIPEKVLIAFSFFGGAAGACIGMRFFHHKTRKPLFSVGIPLLLVTQAVMFVYCFV